MCDTLFPTRNDLNSSIPISLTFGRDKHALTCVRLAFQGKRSCRYL